MKKSVAKYLVLLFGVLLFALLSANTSSAKEYWGDDTEKLLNGSVDITNSTGFTIAGSKITIKDSSGQKHTYRIGKTIYHYVQLGSAPMGFRVEKSSKTQFKNWMTSVISDGVNGLGCEIVVRKGTIVSFFCCS